MRRTITIGLVLLASIASAQSFGEAYTHAFNLLSNSENIGYNITYLSKGKSSVVDKRSMRMEKVGNSYHTKMEGVESYLIDSTSIVIDHEYKSILLNDGIANPAMNEQLKGRLELIMGLEKEAATSKVDSSGSTRRYTLYFNDQEFKEVAFEVSKEDGWFQKLVFVLSTPIENSEEMQEEALTSLEVIIENYEKEMSSFSTPIEKYFNKINGRYQLLPAYSNYQFTNNYEWR